MNTFPLQLKSENGKRFVFDIIRKRYIAYTPEEWVRQQIVHFLIHEKRYPQSVFSIEKGLKFKKIRGRTDIVVYDREGAPFMLVECKSPEVKVDRTTFEQAVNYNITLDVKYIVLSNWKQWFCCEIDRENGKILFLQDIPEYE